MKYILDINHIGRPLLHIKVWFIYSVYIFLLNLLTSKEVNPLFVLLYVVPFIGLFYFFLYSFKIIERNVYKGVSFIIILFLTLLSLSYLLLVKILPYFSIVLTTKSFSTKALLQAIIIEFIKYFIYALLYYIIKELIERNTRLRKIKEEKYNLEIQKKEEELKNAELTRKELLTQKEKIQYQYAFLRAQINPHFLYNTLNVLFSQALPLSESLANNILKLSDLMRYSLDNIETENMRVPLQKEIDHLLTLLEIHELRFSTSKFINYQLKGDTDNFFVPPLSIITVVENAIKYGDLSDPEFPLLLNIDTTDNSLKFKSVNKKNVINNSLKIMSHNVGLSNLRERLDFGFKDKYKIDIVNSDKFYTFEIKIEK